MAEFLHFSPFLCMCEYTLIKIMIACQWYHMPNHKIFSSSLLHGHSTNKTVN